MRIFFFSTVQLTFANAKKKMHKDSDTFCNVLLLRYLEDIHMFTYSLHLAF